MCMKSFDHGRPHPTILFQFLPDVAPIWQAQLHVFYFFNNPLSPVNATCMHVSAVAIMVGPPGASTLKKIDSLSAAANSFSLRGGAS